MVHENQVFPLVAVNVFRVAAFLVTFKGRGCQGLPLSTERLVSCLDLLLFALTFHARIVSNVQVT